ncbi:MAG: 6-bladed beta-propeller, partial [Melioribacteraceae bacterium]
MRRFLIALLIILITAKCSTKKDDIYISNYEDKYELQVIDTLTYYYKDSLFIGRIHDIQLIGDKILISDFFLKKIWVFSNKLDLLKVIGREGKGPGEYSYAPNIIYDSNYIWLSSGRIIDKYNRNLEFIKRMQL